MNITIEDLKLCPQCSGYNTYIIDTDEVEFDLNSGHYYVNYYCPDCGKHFRLCIYFDYTITKHYIRE